MWEKIKPYVRFVALSLGVGAIAALLTRGNMNIYDEINVPPLSPPMWLFPVVWSILYVLMGISAGIVYKQEKSLPGVFCLQLAVNFLWSIIFFNLRAFLLSFIWILFLWVLIIIMIRCFYKISRAAAYINIPYLLWVTFAAYLNYMIYILK
jgi:tryptophan-rich sensory protein